MSVALEDLLIGGSVTADVILLDVPEQRLKEQVRVPGTWLKWESE
jgi:hypothetical protein